MSDKMVSWYSGFTEISDIAKKKGYAVEQEEAVLSVKREELLGSDAVQKALRANFPGADVVPFSDLWGFQLDNIDELFRKFHIGISGDEVENYDSDLSHAVMDSDGRVRAMLLARVVDQDVFVDLLVGATKETQFILMSIKGFIEALKEREECENITMLASSPAVEAMLKRALNKGSGIEELGRVLSISSPEALNDPELTDALEKAAAESVVQKNTWWKHPWARKKLQG